MVQADQPQQQSQGCDESRPMLMRLLIATGAAAVVGAVIAVIVYRVHVIFVCV